MHLHLRVSTCNMTCEVIMHHMLETCMLSQCCTKAVPYMYKELVKLEEKRILAKQNENQSNH